MTDSKVATDFIQAKNYTAVPVSAPRTIRRVVMHSMENVDKPGSARGVALWFAGRLSSSAPEASSHYLCDGSPTCIQGVTEANCAWAAPGANHDGIHVEMAGQAKQTEAEWLADAGLIDIASKLVADVCTRNGIPPVFVNAEGLLRDEPGITTHHEITLACALAKTRGMTGSQYFPAHNSHTDPGRSWPMDHFIGLVRGNMNWPDVAEEPAAA